MVKSSYWPGSIEEPESLIRDGMPLEITGPRRLVLFVENTPGIMVAKVTFRCMIAGYEYWMPKAGEFERSDYQL